MIEDVEINNIQHHDIVCTKIVLIIKWIFLKILDLRFYSYEKGNKIQNNQCLNHKM